MKGYSASRTRLHDLACHPQLTEWQRIGNQVDAAMIFAAADFVNVHYSTHRNGYMSSSISTTITSMGRSPAFTSLCRVLGGFLGSQYALPVSHTCVSDVPD